MSRYFFFWWGGDGGLLREGVEGMEMEIKNRSRPIFAAVRMKSTHVSFYFIKAHLFGQHEA